MAVMIAQVSGLTFWETVLAAVIAGSFFVIVGWWVRSSGFPFRREPLEIKAYPGVYAHGADGTATVSIPVGSRVSIVIGIRSRRFIHLDELAIRFGAGIWRTAATDDIAEGTIKILSISEETQRPTIITPDRDGYRITYTPAIRFARDHVLWLKIDALAQRGWNGYLSIRCVDDYGKTWRISGPIIDAKRPPDP